MTGLCFIGTDTGVGKTFVTCAVARLLRSQGRDIAVCKPVATGARESKGHRRSDDTLALAESAGMLHELERVTPWAFPEPAAPPVAARLAGVELQLDALVKAVRDLARPGRMLLVEGVGGLLCPLTERETVADWAARLEMPLVLVTRRSLGTLNHTLLTLEVARQWRLPIVGIVVNETARPSSVAEETNVEELRKRIDVPILGVVPFLPDEPRAPAEIREVDWWELGHKAIASGLH